MIRHGKLKALRYLIGQAVGGVLFPPYSEAFGRKILYIVATFLYAVFCAIIGAIPSVPSIVVGRFTTGILSAIPSIVLAGSIEDMFNSGPRIWIVYAWSISANLGFCAGPIMGAYITAEIGWYDELGFIPLACVTNVVFLSRRWNFYIMAMITGVLGCFMLAIRESRPSRLLANRLKTLKELTGNSTLQIRNPDETPNLNTYMETTLIRPLRLLFTEPIVFSVAIMSAVAFGLIYLFGEAAPIIYGSFGFNAEHSSLSFIPIALGLLLGIPVRLYDQRIFKNLQRQHKSIKPEDKLAGFALAAPALAVCLWWFAWTIPPLVPGIHWIASMLSLILLGFATNEFDCVLAAYLGDSYTIFSASAFAAMCFLRASFSAVFPLFARQLLTYLDANVGASILAACASVFCVCPVLFYRYGERIRKASKFAKYSLRAYGQNRVNAEEWELETSNGPDHVANLAELGNVG